MLYVPIMNRLSDAKNRPVYLDELRRAGADRVFICPENPFGREPELSCEMNLLCENVEYFTSNGIDVGVWINGLGHGGALSPDDRKSTEGMTRIVGMNGGGAEDSFCPLDKGFCDTYYSYIKRIAKDTGAKLIMIDDDLRLSIHGSAAVGCACELHINEFNKRSGQERLDRQDLYARLFAGKPNKLRSVWLDLMHDTMLNFALGARAALDEIDPDIRLGHCACLPTWDTDGIDSIEISRALAGKTKPFLRLIGAPYWNVAHNFGATNVGTIADAERMQAEWCRKYAPDIEIFSEGDVYPRPRYKTPSIYVEVFDQILGAEERLDGILKYMLDYNHHPLYETGYIDRHLYFADLRTEINSAFSGKTTAGVYIPEEMHKLKDADLTGYSDGGIAATLIPPSAQFANAVSLPVSFRKTKYTPAALVFGENAKYLTEEDKKLPLILDAPAALILKESGIDVGIISSEQMQTPTHEIFDTEKIPLEATGVFFDFKLSEGANVLSKYQNGAPAAFTYTNKSGNRFLIYPFAAGLTDPYSPLYTCYKRQKQLFDTLRGFEKTALPVRIDNQLALHILCEKDNDSMTVGVWNVGADVALPGIISLDEKYSSVRFIGDSHGDLDGDRIVSDQLICQHGFFGFTVKK